MFKLAVDFNGGEKGDMVLPTYQGVWAYSFERVPTRSFMQEIARYYDFEMLVKHGIIEEIMEPQFTETDMICFGKQCAEKQVSTYQAALQELEQYNKECQERENGL